MKPLTHALNITLLASTALAGAFLAMPRASFAQATPPVQQEASQAEAEPDVEQEDIVVLGRNIPDTKRETAEISAVLSAEDFARSGDSSVATALTRVTGLSLVNDRFIFVRGLGERYSSALLNGLPLPSPEPLRRVVPLDIFPTNILASSVVQKTFSPNFSGEFGGGVIDLRTKGVPNEPFLTLKVGVGGNTETTFKDGLLYDGSDLDFLGFDNGLRDIPKPLADAIATGNRINTGSFTPQELQTIGRSLVNARLNVLQTDKIAPDVTVEVSGGRKFTLSNDAELGVIAVFGYDGEFRTQEAIRQDGSIGSDGFNVNNDFVNTRTKNDIIVNGLLGVGLAFGDTDLKLTNLFIRSTTKQAGILLGRDANGGRDLRRDSTSFVERTLITTQFTGSTQVDDLNIDVRAAYANSQRESPYEREIEYRRDGNIFRHDAQRERNRTRFSNIDDDVYAAGIDFTYKFDIGTERVFNVKFGYDVQRTSRSSQSREFRFRALTPLPDAVQQSRVDFLFADVNINPNRLQIDDVTGSNGAAAFEGNLKVDAGYVQVDAEFIPTVRTNFGVRYEGGRQRVRTVDLFGGPSVSPPAIEEGDVLPSATLTWNFAEDMQVRVGASRTLSRPQFRELSEQQFVDIEDDRIFFGNRFLQNSRIDSADIRYEWYFGKDQFFTIGAFYKDIDRPIEEIVSSVGDRPQTTFINVPRARLVGAEVEFKKFFSFETGVAFFDNKRYLVNLNYTFSDGKIKVDAGDIVFAQAGNGSPSPATNFVSDGLRLQGQSRHLANMQLGFEDDTARSQAALTATFVGKRISARGIAPQPDFIQDPGVLLDFTYRKGFTLFNQDFEVSFNARNLLGEDSEEFQEIGSDRIEINTFDIGRSFSLSLTAKF